jgi:tRNA(Glu) U13 pseudouridine synthase TruD
MRPNTEGTPSKGAKEPYDWVAGFNGIGRNMRLMYVHAYQSLLWNQLVSARHKQHGMKVVVGDLVLADTSDTRGSCHPDDEQKVRVRVLTQAEVDTNAVKITDVVMPLPGYAVVFPARCAFFTMDSAVLGLGSLGCTLHSARFPTAAVHTRRVPLSFHAFARLEALPCV